ncbi:CocE/NonD family hydrolase [Cypionkella sp.]|uniref:CocE/NonD family hydrolase n=1 Tax=Cypionkella sp. TaxID=2811411 RepID=UPI00261B0C59|nr:CocE/NonD family hydrolase [Cypionkella sp.]MDB5665702.1 cocE 1 [Cypionkella sp.]
MMNEKPSVLNVELAWIALPDGRRLAARLFLPADGAAVPCILEYLPYRRRDGTRLRDDAKHRWFAANGYAVARVDIAGTGDSEGLLDDEYVLREQDDALAVIDWISRQPWCSGAVGMMGISWGGFNGLQVAARRPPALKAVVTVCTTDDRYATDAHFMGGCLINDMFGWGGSLQSYGARPPDPAMVGADKWRDMWRARIDDLTLFPARWLAHQRRDAFWKQGSVCEDYSAIEAAVLVVGGWLDGYTAPIFALVENLTAPCKAICGPWGHKEPNQGMPGPQIDFLNECKRWWDRWLKGIDTGVEADPAVRLYVMDTAEPVPLFTHRDGHWLGFPSWPAPEIAADTWHFGAWGLTPQAQTAGGVQIVRSPQTTGIKAQEWCPYGQGRIAAEGATDQREDDAGSLCFDSAPLTEPLMIVGAPVLRLRVAANQPQAVMAVRLNTVAPDGTSGMVTFGLLNLAHRDSHEFPEPLEPGQFYDVTLALKPIGQTLPVGHRLRVAISSSYWPMMWPAPGDVTLSVDLDAAEIDLPRLDPAHSLPTPVFGTADGCEPGETLRHLEPTETRTIHLGIEGQTATFDIISHDGDYTIVETGTRIVSTRTKQYHIARLDPLACRTAVQYMVSYQRPDWNVRIETEVACRADALQFHLTGSVRTYEDDTLFAAKDFACSIPRDCL